ncbi:hypothetical protein [Nostoc sp.]|uniref:hypothetical protein n=1 Tax=Nostoc sp. TaxID=1180 RepID=UPI002FF4C78D
MNRRQDNNQSFVLTAIYRIFKRSKMVNSDRDRPIFCQHFFANLRVSLCVKIISQIMDLQKLKAIQQAIKTVNTVNELRQILSTNLT